MIKNTAHCIPQCLIGVTPPLFFLKEIHEEKEKGNQFSKIKNGKVIYQSRKIQGIYFCSCVYRNYKGSYNIVLYRTTIIILNIFIVTGKQCVNTRSDCREYGKSACLPLYERWARENCAEYCGYCSSSKTCVFSCYIQFTELTLASHLW